MKLFQYFTKMIKDDFDTFLVFHKNTIIKYSSIFTIVCICFTIIILLFSWNALPTEVPLWYSKPWGKDRLAPSLWLFFLPAASFFWYVFNSILSIHVTKNHLVFAQILFLNAFLVSVFSCITVSMIIWIIS